MAAVKVLEKNGVRRTVDLARRLGVESPLGENLSIALGTSDLSLLEITSAYGALANQGAWMRPTAIRYVLDSQRKLLEENTPQSKQVVSPELAYVMTYMLRGTIERGTGIAARALGRPAAAKTGTTNDYSNAWFIGYTPQLVTGVWVGYDRPAQPGQGRDRLPRRGTDLDLVHAGGARGHSPGGLPDPRARGAGAGGHERERRMRAPGDDGLHRGHRAEGGVRPRALRAGRLAAAHRAAAAAGRADRCRRTPSAPAPGAPAPAPPPSPSAQQPQS